MFTLQLNELIGVSSFDSVESSNENDQNISTRRKDQNICLKIYLSRISSQNKHSTYKILAVRKISRFDTVSDNGYAEMVQEIRQCSLLVHPYLLYHHTNFVISRDLYMLTEYAAYGSTSDLINAYFKDGFPVTILLYILYAILQALDYLHEHMFIHRSIRAEHVLLCWDGTPKLSGLRHMKLLESGQPEICFEYPSVRDKKSCNHFAPEILAQNTNGYSYSSDLYSIGILLCHLCNGRVPFTEFAPPRMLLEKLTGARPYLIDSSTQNLFNTDSQHIAPEILTKTLPQQLHMLTNELLSSNPHKRPTSKYLLDLNNQNFTLFQDFEIFDTARMRIEIPTLLLPITPAFLSTEEQSHQDVFTEISIVPKDTDYSTRCSISQSKQDKILELPAYRYSFDVISSSLDEENSNVSKSSSPISWIL